MRTSARAGRGSDAYPVRSGNRAGSSLPRAARRRRSSGAAGESAPVTRRYSATGVMPAEPDCAAALSVTSTENGRGRSFVLADLVLIEARIQSALGNELAMRAGFHHPALIEHVDAVGVEHGREPMCDDDGRAPFHQA